MKAISKTAWYCCGVRFQDAQSPEPVIGDQYARQFLSKEGLQYWAEFKGFTNPNGSSIARHYIIDNEIKLLLSAHPDCTVILIGAGFDSRAFRLTGGNWVEIDEPAIIEYKNSVLPETACSNRLQRFAVDFDGAELYDKLAPFAGSTNICVVVEGVFIYLGRAQKESLLNILTRLFPTHTLICDLVKKRFFEKLGKSFYKKLAAQGTAFSDTSDEPDLLFHQFGYHVDSVIPVVQTAKDLHLVTVPRIFLDILMKKTFAGYAVHRFSCRQ